MPTASVVRRKRRPPPWTSLIPASHTEILTSPIASALLVAPADPQKFDVVERLPLAPLGTRSVLIASRTDPWMTVANAQAWALLWAARFIDLGDAGHINVDSGFGPFPMARQLVDRMIDSAAPGVNRAVQAHPALFFAA